MEFGSTVLDNLSVAGDAAHIPDKCFDQLVKRACRGVLSEQERNAIAGACHKHDS